MMRLRSFHDYPSRTSHDQGRRPDGVQVMVNRRHVYVGHMFSNGVTIIDATNPRELKPLHYWTASGLTRTHQLRSTSCPTA